MNKETEAYVIIMMKGILLRVLLTQLHVTLDSLLNYQ